MCGPFTPHWTWALFRAAAEPFWQVPDFGDSDALPARGCPISTRVNSPRNDDRRLLEPVEPEEGLFG